MWSCTLCTTNDPWICVQLCRHVISPSSFSTFHAAHCKVVDQLAACYSNATNDRSTLKVFISYLAESMHFLCVRAILYGVIFTTADSNPTSTLYFSFKTDTLVTYMLKLILSMWCDVILLLLSWRYTDHNNRDPAISDNVWGRIYD